jgi:phage-related protein
LAEGLIKAIPQLVKKIPQIITSLVNGLKDGMGKMSDIGKNLVEGIWKGISNGTSWIKKKIKEWVGNVTKFLKEVFGIKSPSRLFRDEIGMNLALGVGEGFSNTMEDVSKEMGDAIPTEFDADISTNMSMATGNTQMSTYDMMVSAFKQALTEVKVVMDDREMGVFVTETVERVVFA